MSVVIRLARVGKKGERKFRIVVKEKRDRREGNYVELLGSFEKPDRPENLKKDRFEYWVSKGAIPSETVAKIFGK